ncbi:MULTISPECIES: glycoside hydrolase family 5 protein [unclassified Roseateles]|uniref:glycoside hydrolase family 5 protein n=1 Tax=unclassified Roseateles TaxID=2626991 RepID=UPI000700375C|nr:MULTISPECIES: glycoside hydrolase family 5 protein [unclassified Roseateles]KQW43626.1 glycosyl hydrolase family 5 [Pelomonas sp. Root405]KRA71364.1 glycosyl hydrolase family 5 [Pelomonas sp. Root662]
MRTLIPALLLAFGASAGTLAQAQSCGSGGGATVCLTASGSANSNQLNWTVSGNVSRLEVYRDTDADPAGRSRIAVPGSSARSYADTSANTGTPYWYWVKFTAQGGSYNSGAATATRGTACTPTAITPYISANGSWTQTSSASVTAGNSAILGPQPVTGGSWGWSGCGTSGSAREQTITPAASCTATATYTNSCGAKSTQAFMITVPGSMRDLTSVQLSQQMSPAWNVGNSLDASPNETNWGNPLINQQLINAVKAAGFKTIRLPVSWNQYADANGNISPTFMARVTEVVGYARNAGLYVVLNTHHEGSWLIPTYAYQASANARLAKLWTQIANNFKNHDDYLLFAGTNEVMVSGDYGPPTAEYQAVQNGFNQVFVDTVRATGGNNAKRHLVVQGFNTNIDSTLNGFIKPSDSATNRMFLEVHFYDPFNFALNDKSTIWQWGAIATNPAVTETWANEAYVDSQFQKLKTRFVDAGMPVLLGEYGAILKSEYDPAGTYRTYWTRHVTKSAFQRGIVPVWWDNGYDANHQFGLFNRSTGAQYFPDLIKAIVDSAK